MPGPNLAEIATCPRNRKGSLPVASPNSKTIVRSGPRLRGCVRVPARIEIADHLLHLRFSHFQTPVVVELGHALFVFPVENLRLQLPVNFEDAAPFLKIGQKILQSLAFFLNTVFQAIGIVQIRPELLGFAQTAHRQPLEYVVAREFQFFTGLIVGKIRFDMAASLQIHQRFPDLAPMLDSHLTHRWRRMKAVHRRLLTIRTSLCLHPAAQ